MVAKITLSPFWSSISTARASLSVMTLKCSFFHYWFTIMPWFTIIQGCVRLFILQQNNRGSKLHCSSLIGHLLWPITDQLIWPITSRLLWPIKTIKISVPKCNQENGIRIFDPMLFDDTVVSKIMEDFNTKCYVMNNEEKLFQ